jgi:hypothetical protein
VTTSVTQPAPTTTPSTTTATTAPGGPSTTAATPRTSAAEPAGKTILLPRSVAVVSMTWPTMDRGWVLADRLDGSRVLLKTTDAGSSWTPTGPADLTGASEILFAETTDGWIVGDEGLLSTHDGGATWSPVSIAGGIAEGAALAEAGGKVHVAYMGGNTSRPGVHIATSPTDHDAFVPSAVNIPSGAGPILDATMSAGGPYGEMTYNDRTLIGAAQVKDGQWGTWDFACPYANATATAGLSPNGQALAIACGPSGFGDEAPIVGADLSHSTIAWTTIEPASPTQGESRLEFATATDDGVRVVIFTTADGRAEIASSTDRGATWPTRTPLAAGTTPSPIAHLPDGTLLIATGPLGGLSSRDGLTWTPVATSPS